MEKKKRVFTEEEKARWLKKVQSGGPGTPVKETDKGKKNQSPNSSK